MLWDASTIKTPVRFARCARRWGRICMVCLCVWTRIHMLVAWNQSRSRCSLRGLSELQATERHCAITAPAAARHAAVATARAWSWHGTQRRWTLPAAGQRLLDAHPWPLLGARGPSGTGITAATGQSSRNCASAREECSPTRDQHASRRARGKTAGARSDVARRPHAREAGDHEQGLLIASSSGPR